MTRKATLLLGLVLVLVAVVFSAWAYPSMAGRVPTHWDLAGNVNGYSSRLTAVSIMPIVMAVMWLLILVLPAISPRGYRLEGSAGAFYGSMLAVLAMMLVVHFVTLRASMGASAPPRILIIAPIGVLLAVLGSFMGKLKKNFFIGVRTPWTLASDEVWLRTNKFAGQLLIAGGIVIVAASFVPSATIPALIGVIAIVTIAAIGYSYVLYRRLEGFG
jgi:uncharacterized membrane protein